VGLFQANQEDFWYILGYALGDGYLASREGDNRFTIASTDLQIIRDIKGRGFAPGKIHEEVAKAYSQKEKSSGIPSGKFVYRVVFCKKRMKERLLGLGFPVRKSEKGSSYVLKSPEKLFWDFYRGFWDSDGWLSACPDSRNGGKTWRYHSGLMSVSKRQIEWFRDELIKREIRVGSVKTRKGSSLYYLQVGKLATQEVYS